jgi:hypothetical protein
VAGIGTALRANARLARDAAGTRPRTIVLGDSHAALFEDVPGFLPIWIGAVTLHRLSRPGELLSQVRSRRRPALLLPGLRVGRRDTLLVNAGEIDVRCHLDEQISRRGRTEDEVIGELVSGLLAALAEVREQIGCRAGAVAIPPPIRALRPDDQLASEFPIRGSLPDRVRWTNQLNRRLAEVLTRDGHGFLPMPEGLTNPDGSLREELSDGNVHLDRRLAGVVVSGASLGGDS